MEGLSPLPPDQTDPAPLMGHPDHLPDRLQQVLLAVATACVIAALGLSFLAWRDSRNGPWDPLGDYPQSVPTKHVFHLNEPVTLTGQKCSKVDGLTTRTDRVWQAQNVAGVTIQDEFGVERIRYRSCGPTPSEHVVKYVDAIPPAVAALVKGDPTKYRIWTVTGEDVPFDAKTGRVGEARSYSSQQFELIP